MATDKTLPVASFTITYDRTQNNNIDVTVDQEFNGGISTFTFNESTGKSNPEKIRLSVKSDSDIVGGWSNTGTLINYPSESSEGSVDAQAVEIVETLEFNQQASEELNYMHVEGKPFSVIFSGKILLITKKSETEYEFDEADPSEHPCVLIGRTIKVTNLEAGQTVLGIADVTYSVNTRFYDLEGARDKVIVGFINAAGGIASTTITLEQEDIQYKNVVITVKDFCSSNTLEGVSVVLNDDPLLSQITNVSGEVHFEHLQKNITYNIKMTKDGYMDSDKDELANDSFVIE
jgi:hypothetical protein